MTSKELNIHAERRETYLKGFKEGEKRAINDFLRGLRLLLDNSAKNIKNHIKDDIELYKERLLL